MVHALEIIHGLLVPAGFLLDVHPSGDPPPIEVRVGEAYFLAGWLTEVDDGVEYLHADQALQSVLERGLYTLEGTGTFSFNTYAPSLDDLRAYIKEDWEDARIDDQVAGRVVDLMKSPVDEKELVLRELVKITRLRPL
jgi:hypothetical protein